MAIASDTVWEVRYDGDDSNGGGYSETNANQDSVDYSLQDSAELSLTDLAMTAAGTTLTSATGGFTNLMLGNYIQITSGTNFTAGWYCITGYTNTNTVTIDRDATTGSNGSVGVGKVGGAFGTPGCLSDAAVGGNTGYIKYNASSYTYTVSSAGKGGYVLGPTDAEFHLIGYETTRGDYGLKPTLNAGSTTNTRVVLIDATDYAPSRIINIKAIGNSSTTSACLEGNSSGYVHVYRCEASGASAGAGFKRVHASECSATTCQYGFLTCSTSYCIATSCTTSGFEGGSTQGLKHAYSIADSCNKGFENFVYGSAIGCTAYNSTLAGFENGSGGCISFFHCVAVDNGGYGFYGIDFLYGCASYGNTSGRSTSIRSDEHSITLTVNPFVDPVNGDFNLNNLPGGGAALRGASFDL